MGTVYAAEDRLKLELGDPEPMVAVKVLQARLAVHEAALMALEREAAKAQALRTPMWARCSASIVTTTWCSSPWSCSPAVRWMK